MSQCRLHWEISQMGKIRQTSENGCLFQCEQTFSQGGTEGSKRKRKDTEIAAKNERKETRDAL